MQTIVDISDAKVSADPADTLVTYSLGSCIGVAVYDPAARVAGLLHCQLPTGTMDPAKAAGRPAMYADTGLAHLMKLMAARGASPRRLQVRLAGGAQMFDDGGVFSIGKRNHAAVRKALWQHGLMVAAEAVGGSSPRTMYVGVADGQVSLRTGTVTTTL
ncbi:MAG: Chemotaxis protein CheD [Phycisphaerales bacterium]|nr:Chemotaxis protein CheD [Phycisphaerales bacterium]